MTAPIEAAPTEVAPIEVARKWRPGIGLVVAAVMLAALALPLAGLFLFPIYEDLLVHQTEAELIGQTAVLAAAMQREIETTLPPETRLGAEATPVPPQDPTLPYQPVLPSLDLGTDPVLPVRPPAISPARPADPAFAALGARLEPLLTGTQRITLAGFRLLDPEGVVIAGRDELGLSLAQVEEVAAALHGRFHSVMRQHFPQHGVPPIYSLSRGTTIRIFAAMPVIVRGHVAGVVYASRTPSNIVKSLYDERGKAAAALAAILLLATLIGIVFRWTIVRPIRALAARTAAIARGERAALSPLAHHGTAEFAALSQSFLDMAQGLQNRSDYIATFAAHVSHELKSPLTSIQGAAELLRDDLDGEDPGCDEPVMTREDRQRFLGNIIADAGRLTAVVQRLRELARAEAMPTAGTTALETQIAELRGNFPALRIEAAGDLAAPLRISPENARIVLAHLADNARQNGAKTLSFTGLPAGDLLEVTVRDDGPGISPANRARIFDSFFTTRRESGGTGMGLPIVRAMLQAHGGGIELLPDGDAERPGAGFVLSIPLDRP